MFNICIKRSKSSKKFELELTPEDSARKHFSVLFPVKPDGLMYRLLYKTLGDKFLRWFLLHIVVLNNQDEVIVIPEEGIRVQTCRAILNTTQSYLASSAGQKGAKGTQDTNLRPEHRFWTLYEFG